MFSISNTEKASLRSSHSMFPNSSKLKAVEADFTAFSDHSISFYAYRFLAGIIILL
jgi:hypothetical protein